VRNPDAFRFSRALLTPPFAVLLFYASSRDWMYVCEQQNSRLGVSKSAMRLNQKCAQFVFRFAHHLFFDRFPSFIDDNFFMRVT
jgi:hypothetical protein